MVTVREGNHDHCHSPACAPGRPWRARPYLGYKMRGPLRVVGEENTVAAVQARSLLLCQYFFARFTKPVILSCVSRRTHISIGLAIELSRAPHRQPPASRGRILLTSPMVSKLPPRWQPRSPLGRRLDIPGRRPVLGTILAPQAGTCATTLYPLSLASTRRYKHREASLVSQARGTNFPREWEPVVFRRV